MWMRLLKLQMRQDESNKQMTKKSFIEKWKEREKWLQTQKPLIYDCIHAKEIVYNAYRFDFIKCSIYNLAMERIERTVNSIGKNGLFEENKEIKSYYELVEKKWHESLMENQKK